MGEAAKFRLIKYIIVLILKKKRCYLETFLKSNHTSYRSFMLPLNPPNLLYHVRVTFILVNFQHMLGKELNQEISRFTRWVGSFFGCFFFINSIFLFFIESFLLFFFHFHLSTFGWFWTSLHNLFWFAFDEVIAISNKYPIFDWCSSFRVSIFVIISVSKNLFKKTKLLNSIKFMIRITG
jgi:hypothetical protein